MGVYVVKNGQPWWTGLAGTVAGHLIDGMFQRDKAYRQQKKADANYDAFYNDLYGDQAQQQANAQPKGLISGTIDAQLQRDITPPSYEPITVDQMNQNAPATGVFSNLGSGIVATPPSANVSINVPAQPAASVSQGIPFNQRFIRAMKHLHLQDPTALLKMAAEPVLKNDAAFQHAQRVSNAVGDFPVGGTADEQTAFFAKNLPYYGDQGTNLAKVYDTAHPGYQMNVVDNGDRKDAVTLDRFSGTVKNPLTMKQGLNPDKQAANAVKLQQAAISAAARKAGGGSSGGGTVSAAKDKALSPADIKLYLDSIPGVPQQVRDEIVSNADTRKVKLWKSVVDSYLKKRGYLK